MTGIVVHGKHLGRTLGFPTANIQPDAPSTAENGVYAAWIEIEGYPNPLPCMVNQGKHPTVPEGPPTIEAHILRFCDDIYGLRVTLTYVRRLRGEKRFEGLPQLIEQLERDSAAVAQILEPNA